MSAPLLEAHGLRKRYRDGGRERNVVDGVDLTLHAGSLWVLRGPSGSGKSTLLGLLCGLLSPTEGEVRLDGRPFSRLRDHHRTQRRRESIGAVFQSLGLIERMSVLENVLLPCVPTGGADAEQLGRAEALLDRFGLSEHRLRPAARLSGGERQRAAIARALLHSPPVVVLDEPTAHLDADRAGEVATLLCELRDEGRAVLAATHDPRLAEHPGVDRQLELRDGVLQ